MLGDQSNSTSNFQPGSLKAKLKTQQREQTRILTPAIPFIGLGRDEALPTPFSQYLPPVSLPTNPAPTDPNPTSPVEPTPEEKPEAPEKNSPAPIVRSLREITEKKPFNIDLFEQFLKVLLRCFYTDNEIIVGELLLREQRSISEKDLSKLTLLPEVQIRKALNVLEKDIIVAKDNYVSELEKLKYNERQQITKSTGITFSRKAAVASTYWRISDLVVVNTLYKITHLDERLETDYEKSYQDDEFLCNTCNVKINSIVAMTYPRDPVDGIFLCKTCGVKLQQGNTWLYRRESSNRLERCQSELSQLRELVIKLLDVNIPKFPIIDKQELEDRIKLYSSIDIPPEEMNTNADGTPMKVEEGEGTQGSSPTHQGGTPTNMQGAGANATLQGINAGASSGNKGAQQPVSSVIPWIAHAGLLRPSTAQQMPVMSQQMQQQSNFLMQGNIQNPSYVNTSLLAGSLLSNIKIGSHSGIEGYKVEVKKQEERESTNLLNGMKRELDMRDVRGGSDGKNSPIVVGGSESPVVQEDKSNVKPGVKKFRMTINLKNKEPVS